MHRMLPPLCLLLALALAIAGFAMLAVEPPKANVDLHRAAAARDEQLREALEEELRRRQRHRKLLVGALFVGSGLAVVAAFLTMQPAEGRRRGD